MIAVAVHKRYARAARKAGARRRLEAVCVEPVEVRRNERDGRWGGRTASGHWFRCDSRRVRGDEEAAREAARLDWMVISTVKAATCDMVGASEAAAVVRALS